MPDSKIVPQQETVAALVARLNNFDPADVQRTLATAEAHFPALRMSAGQRLAELDQRARLIGQALDSTTPECE